MSNTISSWFIPFWYRVASGENTTLAMINKKHSELMATGNPPAFPKTLTLAKSTAGGVGILGVLVAAFGIFKENTLGKLLGIGAVVLGAVGWFIDKFFVKKVGLQESDRSKEIEESSLQTSEMIYANTNTVRQKSVALIEKLSQFIQANKGNLALKENPSLFFKDGDTVPISDVHGDFIHLMLTLHRHGLLDKDLNLKENFPYVFLGDIYDRGDDADVIDHWLNIQIQRGVKIHRLVGNHEMSFFYRTSEGYPTIHPSNDIYNDMDNNYQVTEDLLRNIANGSLLAAYLDPKKTDTGYSKLYVHSFITNKDYERLGLEPNSDISIFVNELNKRFRECGKIAYQRFMEGRHKDKFDWEAINQPFRDDPLFTPLKTSGKRDSIVWRRTEKVDSDHNSTEIKAEIPNNVYQIVGHTPVHYFTGTHPGNKPLIIGVKTGNGKVQFSDVGIGYYYENDFERQALVINPKDATVLNTPS